MSQGSLIPIATISNFCRGPYIVLGAAKVMVVSSVGGGGEEAAERVGTDWHARRAWGFS